MMATAEQVARGEKKKKERAQIKTINKARAERKIQNERGKQIG
jgi:hypothetical protein